MNENVGYHNIGRCTYMTQYHVIWCPKFQYGIWDDTRKSRLKEILEDVCQTYHYEIKELEITSDHIHIYVDVPYTVAPCDVARTLRSRSAVRMLHKDLDLRKIYQYYGAVWSHGYFITSEKEVSEEIMTEYIQEESKYCIK